VIAAFPIIDYQYTHAYTQQKHIKESLDTFFANRINGTYANCSPITYINMINSNNNITILVGHNDTHVGNVPILNYYNKLKCKKAIYTYNVDHTFNTITDQWREILTSFLS
jgi:hypothetical protein